VGPVPRALMGGTLILFGKKPTVGRCRCFAPVTPNRFITSGTWHRAEARLLRERSAQLAADCIDWIKERPPRGRGPRGNGGASDLDFLGAAREKRTMERMSPETRHPGTRRISWTMERHPRTQTLACETMRTRIYLSYGPRDFLL